jgi:hypothetical protein
MQTDQAVTPAAPAGQPATPPAPPPGPNVPSPRNLNAVGAVLSYLVPGLGQIIQGRIGKGVLFLLCVYTLFFYGVYLGAAEAKVDGRTYRVASNVYIPVTSRQADSPPQPQPGGNLLMRGVSAVASYPRPQIVGQLFVGAAAWPAIIQYYHAKARHEDPNVADAEITRLYAAMTEKRAAAAEKKQRADEEKKQGRAEEAKELLADQERLLKDAKEAGDEAKELERLERAKLHPILGDFMREPTLRATNAVFNAGDKRLELAWVFTVIAGVLNVLVIYDALAGPAFTSPEDAKRKAG